ncbi:TIGR03435 family protein [Terriglobus sp. TAA 43]|uniref:TIGR03435 family protein n=1 Tax=Terriglobus sp. TAA 43 TaxID=278961 RepID=UPI000645DE3C|nr:TIGR03435 family protein [Terriglobus sp. TAA 43]
MSIHVSVRSGASRLRFVSFAAVLLFCGTIPGRAQTAFDVASVRPNNGEGRSLLEATPGRFAATNISVQRLLLIAYGVQDFQMVGAPSWTASEHYDVTAKASGGTTVNQMEGPMLQALLQERFGLKAHREIRVLPRYELRVIEGTSKLHRSIDGSCRPYVKDAQPDMASNGKPAVPFCGLHRTEDGSSRRLEGKGVTFADLAVSLSHSYNTDLNSVVADATGLSGGFDMSLQWTNDADVAASATGLSAAPSLPTALREQLGLKLERSKGEVEVLVIDHIDRPGAN